VCINARSVHLDGPAASGQSSIDRRALPFLDGTGRDGTGRDGMGWAPNQRSKFGSSRTGAPCRHRWTKVKCTAKRAARRRSNGLLTRRSLALTPQYPEPLQARPHGGSLALCTPSSCTPIALGVPRSHAASLMPEPRPEGIASLLSPNGVSRRSWSTSPCHPEMNGNDGSGAH
jgi:hypothetical protein